MLDDYLPKYHFSTRHSILIKCSPERAYETLKSINFSESPLIRFLFWARGLNSVNFQNLRERFTLLNTIPNKEIVLGLIGRPWTLNGGILDVPAEDFQSFNESGYAKMVWSFTFEGLNENKTLVSTETRILCTSQKCRRNFSIYWFFIRPFSGLVRREILKILKKNAEA